MKSSPVAGVTDTPRYNALLAKANDDPLRYSADGGALQVWRALAEAERELAEAKSAISDGAPSNLLHLVTSLEMQKAVQEHHIKQCLTILRELAERPRYDVNAKVYPQREATRYNVNLPTAFFERLDAMLAQGLPGDGDPAAGNEATVLTVGQQNNQGVIQK